MTKSGVGPILVTGSAGQVGGEVVARAGAYGFAVIPVARHDCDLTNPTAIQDMLGSRDWAAVINCAAYTAVDKAESDIASAWAVNATAPALIAHHCAKRGIPILHVSTDYVFAGTGSTPYRPEDSTGPLSVYGASKLGGEIAVASANLSYAILRTAWVVSGRGTNFVKTMRRFGRERDVIKVVADQRGSPTSAADIADALLLMAKRMLEPNPPSGIWHFVNSGEATWHELAEMVFVDLEENEGVRPILNKITTEDYPTPARRPSYSRLDTSTLTRDFEIHPRPWQEAIADILSQLNGAEKDQE